ncbi:MAG TPA: hypothetical protein VM573_06475 [Actinomycetota bacterium]|jgi:hypothetical protein|nr:hypothetical protein [Actinomycetota bacterium]
MRKLVALASVGLLVLALAAGPATAGKKKKKKKPPVEQTVEGSILLPAPFPQDRTACFAGLHRRLMTPAEGPQNGVFGYLFEVDEKTWGTNFVLEVTESAQPADLDIYFYLHFPPLEEWPSAPNNAGAPVSVDYTTREVGGESGEVPPETNKVIVCMYGGDQGSTGLNASFKYTAGTKVKLPKK